MTNELTAHGASLSPPAHIIQDLIPHDLQRSSLHCSFETNGISTCFKTFSWPVPFVSPHPNIMHFLLLIGSWYDKGICATSITSFLFWDNLAYGKTMKFYRKYHILYHIIYMINYIGKKRIIPVPIQIWLFLLLQEQYHWLLVIHQPCSFGYDNAQI